MSRPLLTAIALGGLLMAAAGLWSMFPQIGEIGEEAGVSGVPYIAILSAGLIVGVVLALLRNRVGKGFDRYFLNLGVGFLIWGVVGAVYGLVYGEGSYLHRAVEGRVIGLWFSAVYVLICALPGVLGSYAALTGSKVPMSAAVAMIMGTAVISMVYSEARYNLLLDQDVLPSLMGVVGLVLFVEGMGMLRREEESRGDPSNRKILTRNLAFLAAFLMISSVIAAVPFLFGGGITGSYESRTIFGRAAIGLALLLPLGILAIVRRRS
jgi:hypothetical protein